MIKTYKNENTRFIDNNIINNCYRPHLYKQCALYSITTIYNYLNNDNITPEEVRNKIKWDLNDITDGKIGNKSIINGLKII